MFLKAILAGSSLLAFTAPALAQTMEANDASAAATSSDEAGAAEIVVTATKREERLQRVPIAVTVVSADQLVRQNVTGVTELTRSAPTLTYSGYQGALSIRGIGGGTFSRTAESSVGIVVDGVALGNASAGPPPLFDAARVEVLNGPQGTLFGRNASAGVLNVVTNAPNPDKLEVIAHADIATRNNYIGRATINLPVASNAALRVSGMFQQQPEEIYSRFDNTWLRDRTYGLRGRFKWDPTDRITINLSGDYARNQLRNGATWVTSQSTPGSVMTSRLAACGVTTGPRNQDACIDGGTYTNNTAWGVSAQADMDMGGVTLSTISAYRSFTNDAPLGDSDSSPVDRLNLNSNLQKIRNFSQELRLTSGKGGLVEYTLGLYYFDSAVDADNDQRGLLYADYPLAGICPFYPGAPLVLCQIAPLGQHRVFKVGATSLAAYGQATINIAPNFRVLLGARVGNEKTAVHSTATVSAGAIAPFASIATIDAKASDTYFSYRGGVQYDLTRNVMAYVTYTRGYKGPAINDANPVSGFPVVVKPEIPHSTEVGIKATLLNGKLGFNLTGFRNVVTDFQTQFYDPSVVAFVYGNAPKLTSQGVQLDLFGSPVRGLTLGGGLLYNDAKYGAGYNVACYQLQTAAQGCQAGGYTSAEGNQLSGAPKWKATANFQYAAPLGGNLEGFFGGDMVYQSRVDFSANRDPGTVVPEAAIFSARAGLRTSDERFGLSVFARNLFDVYRPVLKFATPTAAQQLDFAVYSSVPGSDSRRLIGVSLDARF